MSMFAKVCNTNMVVFMRYKIQTVENSVMGFDMRLYRITEK